MESQPQNPEFRINPANFHNSYTSYMHNFKIQARLCRGAGWFGLNLVMNQESRPQGYKIFHVQLN